MALGFREAKELPSPLPKQNVQPVSAFPPSPEQNETAPRVIPFSEIQAAAILGPSNPLEGPSSPDDIAGIVTASRAMLATMEKILVATRATHPNLPLAIKEETGINNSLQPSSGAIFKTFIDKRPVPSLWLRVDNQSGQTLFVGLEDMPSVQNIPVPTGSNVIFDRVAIAWFSILLGATGGAIPINGLSDTRGAPTQGANYVVLTAYGNSEWANVWGMTS